LSDPLEVLFNDISLNKIIGEGAFGKVYSGRLLKQTMEVEKRKQSSPRKTDKEEMKMGLTVAVKMLQSNVSVLQPITLKYSFIYFRFSSKHGSISLLYSRTGIGV